MDIEEEEFQVKGIDLLFNKNHRGKFKFPKMKTGDAHSDIRGTKISNRQDQERNSSGHNYT